MPRCDERRRDARGLCARRADLDVVRPVIIALGDGLDDTFGFVRRAPVAMLHHELARTPERLVPHIARGAERGAVITGSGLDVDGLEWRALTDLPVGHAVHGATTRHA